MISSTQTTASRISLQPVRRTPVPSVRCCSSSSNSNEHKVQRTEPLQSRRAALACLSAFCALQTAGASQALGIETLQSIFPDKDPKAASGAAGAAGRKKLQDAEDSFQSSDLLKRLREQTTLNSKKNKIDLQNKYCYRQAELGIGDCGGLSLIPGMTKNGKQKTPDWLSKALGIKDEDKPKDVPRPQGFPDINGKPTT
ncbi:hypothetical protein ABBQ38_004836 [Trebouxia sp. C0009 RCD-2024]